MESILRSMRNSVSGLSAARCKYVKSSCPSLKRSYSSGTGSLTFTIRSAVSKTSSGPSTTCPPASSYSSSENPAPLPAPAWTYTSWPLCTNSATPSGCMETRPSMSLISLGIPTTVAIAFLSLVAPILSLPYSKATITMQGCWQRLLLIVAPGEQLLVYLPVPGGCVGPQCPARVASSPDHYHQIVAQSIEVSLISKLGGEALQSLSRIVLPSVEAPICERLNAPSQGVEQGCYQERGGHHRECGLLAREDDEEPLHRHDAAKVESN